VKTAPLKEKKVHLLDQMESLLLKAKVHLKEKKVVLLKEKRVHLLDQMENLYHLEKVVLL
tara:strand:- start:615 stop:794 length:180 start_codon:yes stop_codon:yes gene_type:complete